jgi:hypothetical protein
MTIKRLGMQTNLNTKNFISVISKEKTMSNFKEIKNGVRKKKRLKIEDSATYRISVQGYLDDNWSDQLAEMTITIDTKDDQAPISTLLGRTRDQAELVGVLNALYELRMPILSVEIILNEKLSEPKK